MTGLIKQTLSISLRKKVLLGYIFMSALVFLILAVIGISAVNIRAKYDSLNEISNDSQLVNQLKADIDGVRAAFLLMALTKNQEVRSVQEGVIAYHMGRIDENIARTKKGRYSKHIAEIEKVFIPFKKTLLEEIIPLIKEDSIGDMMRVLGTVQAPRANVFLKTANDVIEISRKDFIDSKKEINIEIKSTAIKVLVIVISVFSTAFMFSFWFINRYIIGVLHSISSSAEKVAGGNLAIKVSSETTDEFGRLADDVNKIIQTMQNVLRDIANKTCYILKDATNLTLYGKEVSQRVDKDLERTTAAASATEEMSSTIGDVAQNINVASKAAENANILSSQGKQTIDETVSSIEEVNKQIASASGKVKALAKLSQKIDDAVVMIKDIADQTNLLALNAAIEAARAGEQGRGFAVVADEVRKLAQRTADATADINNILGSIHSGTVEATEMMELAVEKAKVTGEFAHRLDEAFRGIYESFNKVSDMVTHVVTATEEQSATAAEISNNLSSVAEDAKGSSATVKNMALSFSKFNANAKEFLKLLDGFNDPKMKIGVVKADYVLWFHRILDTFDSEEVSIVHEELHADKSRMGHWYYGDGKDIFGGFSAFKELEPSHRKLHELGIKAYELSKKGDKEAAKNCLKDIVALIDKVISILDRLETEAA